MKIIAGSRLIREGRGSGVPNCNTAELAEVRRAFRVKFDNALPHVRSVAADGTVAFEERSHRLPLSADWFTCARAAPPPPPTLQPRELEAIELELNTDRVGGDYRSTNMDRPSACATACAGAAQCKAWTWVKAGIQGPSAKCWLKSTVPAPQASDCCISGVKGEPRTDRVGGDYQSTNVDNWAACATGCASDAQCRAWTWVKAGIQGPGAKCWLKSTVPAPQSSDCCVSGIK